MKTLTTDEFKSFLKTKDNFWFKHTFRIGENNQTFVNKRFRLYILPFWFIWIIISSPFIALFTNYSIVDCYKEGILEQFTCYTTLYTCVIKEEKHNRKNDEES